MMLALSVTICLQVGRLTQGNLIIDRNHNEHKHTSLQAVSRYTNTAVTLIEQSHVYS